MISAYIGAGPGIAALHAFDTPLFNAPCTSYGAGSFGVISSQVTSRAWSSSASGSSSELSPSIMEVEDALLFVDFRRLSGSSSSPPH